MLIPWAFFTQVATGRSSGCCSSTGCWCDPL